MSAEIYDGSKTFVHEVKSGESLSSIAEFNRFNYGNPVWQPIFRYNHFFLSVMGNDPNLIQPGFKIVIPRSPEGYSRMLAKLHSLKKIARAQGDSIKYQLEGDYYKHKADRVLLDFAGDVLTTIATFGASALKASKSAKVAAASRGQQRAAAEYLARKHSKEFTQGVIDKFKDTAIDAVISVTDDKTKSGGTLNDVRSLQKSFKKGGKAIATVSLQAGKSLLDMADLILDYAKPSVVADKIMLMTVGQTTQQSYQEAIKTIERSVDSQQRALDRKIAKYSREKEVLYF
jgi:hypothetical protein